VPFCHWQVRPVVSRQLISCSDSALPHAPMMLRKLVLLCCSPLHFMSGAVALACCRLSLLEPHQYCIDFAPPEFLAVTPMPRRAAVPSPSHPHVLASLYSRRHLLLRTIVEASPSPCVAMRRSASSAAMLLRRHRSTPR
jgi:hypothetical protein